MSVGASSPHLGGHPNGFHELLWRCAVTQRRLGMSPNAVWALRYVRNCDSDDLFGLRRQCPIGEDSLAEGIECYFDVMSEGSSFLREFTGSRRISRICHVLLLCFP
jgi:hypothetical protein